MQHYGDFRLKDNFEIFNDSKWEMEEISGFIRSLSWFWVLLFIKDLAF